jgi:hypothetical protein
MPSSRQTKPIIIAASRATHNHSILSPSTPPSPKQVRFAPRSAELASRPLTPQEAWSLYHFETHARSCRLCSSHSLCSAGYALSQDVQVLVRQHGGEICSTRPDSEGKWIRVEIPHGYDRARSPTPSPDPLASKNDETVCTSSRRELTGTRRGARGTGRSDMRLSK